MDLCVQSDIHIEPHQVWGFDFQVLMDATTKTGRKNAAEIANGYRNLIYPLLNFIVKSNITSWTDPLTGALIGPWLSFSLGS